MSTIGTRAAAAAGALAASAPALHLGMLTVASAVPHRCGRSQRPRFAVVVPAHDEADTIDSTLGSIGSIDYPKSQLAIVVVADNCSDDTAAVARSHGVTVLERDDPDRRGKGYALDHAFRYVLADTTADAVVVIDADTTVDPDLLSRAAFHVEAGAAAIQVDYRVRNPHESWRTRLLDVAFTCKHLVRNRGREALRCSIGLHGNGMVFTRGLLEQLPYAATSVVEDIEYGMMLVEAGYVVGSCDRTYVAGDMPSDAESAASQRVRWELGHAEMRRRFGLRMLLPALVRRDRVRSEAAVDLLTPPLGTVVATLGAATLVGATGRRWFGPVPVWVLAAGWIALVAHVGSGLLRSPSSWRAIPAIARVPWYLAWKVALRTSAMWQDQVRHGALWTRTERSGALHDESRVPVVDQ